MKKNLLQQLTEENNLNELNLELNMEDIEYIRSATAYAVNQGLGMLEAEIIRKDLIGMAGEAKKEGELLKNRLGEVRAFAKGLVAEGKRGNRKDQMYFGLENIGFFYIFGGLIVFFIYFFAGELKALESGFVNILYLLWVLVYPWLLALWNFYLYGRFALRRRFETFFSLLAVLLLILPVILFRYVWKDTLPLSQIRIPNWGFLVLSLAGSVIYWYGKTKFNAILEEIAGQYHLKIEK